MSETQVMDFEAELDAQAKILRQLWYEGKGSPQALSELLNFSVPQTQAYLDDLADRDFVFQFIRSPDGNESSVYCLTRRTQRRIHRMLASCTRYKLKSAWDALRREQILWLLNQQV